MSSFNTLASNLPPAEQFREDIRQGQAEQVYQRMQEVEGEFAGQADYDYAFGLAALRSGRAAEATWSLERVILVESRHYRAKLALAEAYMDMGRYNQAQRLLDEVKSAKTSSSIVSTTQRLQERLENLRNPRFWAVNTHAIVGLGYDSNVSSSPASDIFYNGQEYALEEDPSVFSELTLRQRLDYTPDEAWRFSAGYRFRDSRPYQESEFTRQRFQVDLESRYQQNNWQISAQPAFVKGWRDSEGEIQEARLGLNGRISMQGHTLLGFGSLTNLSYEQSPADNNDGQFYLLGGGWVSQPAGSALPLTLVLTGYYLSTDQPDSTVGDFSGPGANANFIYQFNGKLRFSAKAGWSNRSYSSSRNDNQLTAGLNANYQLNPQWRIEPEINFTNMSSDSEIAEHNRLTAKVSVRYDFQSHQF
ncbi:MAG: tetratricopeptide repeat protein [Marinospirillum sp.]|nr:tetratricopeptide repeat protein [Marinospirillum sp.]